MGGAGGATGDIERLPEECISRILSFTSPRDVCRSSAASTAFLSAAKSDIVWDRFLPPDWEGILRRRSCDPVPFSSRRDLYFRLCDSISIDDGSKRVWLEKATGKKCYMLSARSLGITWGNDSRYWRWISVPDARFPEVAQLLDVCWLAMHASISSRDLSPGTRYGAYLVMRLSGSSYGLDDPPQETVITVGGVPSSTRTVRLQEQREGGGAYHLRLVPLDDLWWPAEVGVGDQGEDEDNEGLLLPEEAPATDTGSPHDQDEHLPEEGGVGEELEKEDLLSQEEAPPTTDTESSMDEQRERFLPEERSVGEEEDDEDALAPEVEAPTTDIESSLDEPPDEDAYRLPGELLEHLWRFPPDEADAREEEDEEDAADLLPPEEGPPAMDTGSLDEPIGGGHSDDESNASESSLPGPDDQVEQATEEGEGIIWVPGAREDGWMELAMGDFFVEVGGEELVEIRLNGWQSMHWKSGLIVHGLQLRPMP